MARIAEDIESAVQLLNKGDLVAIPTETVYGLAGNALDARAVSRIFAAKNRPFFDPLIVHIGDVEQLPFLTTSISERAKKLIDDFWPGPMTLLFNKSIAIPDIVTSGLDKVAIRMPNHPMTLALLKQLSFPLAAPSANPFGYVSPTCAEHVQTHLGNIIPLILDGGPCTVGVESTIVDATDDVVRILRLGGITVEQIEDCLNEKVIVEISSSQPAAPGMLDSHYAPRKPMSWAFDNEQENQDRVGYLSFAGNLKGSVCFELSPSGDLTEAASKLFQGMRWLDGQDVDRIVVKKMPEIGLGRAMNDRLSRACRS